MIFAFCDADGSNDPLDSTRRRGDTGRLCTARIACRSSRASTFTIAAERSIGSRSRTPASRSLSSKQPKAHPYPTAWREVTDDSSAFASTNPLWIASYRKTPELVGGWTTYAVWQYTDRGHVAGIDTIVDRDRFNGTQSELNALRVSFLVAGAKA